MSHIGTTYIRHLLVLWQSYWSYIHKTPTSIMSHIGPTYIRHLLVLWQSYWSYIHKTPTGIMSHIGPTYIRHLLVLWQSYWSYIHKTPTCLCLPAHSGCEMSGPEATSQCHAKLQRDTRRTTMSVTMQARYTLQVWGITYPRIPRGRPFMENGGQTY